MLKLLIGYDGSPCSADAIDDLARAGLPHHDVDALLIYVADIWSNLPGPDYSHLHTPATERLYQQVQAVMDEAQRATADGKARLERLFPRWQIGVEVARDSVYWGLVKKASERRADLLVVGSQGRTSVGRMILGSVSHNALLYADCSVRVGRCRPGPDVSGAAGAAAGGTPVRVMIGWDGSPDATVALRAVAQRRWPPGSEARIVSALDARLASMPLPVLPTAGGSPPVAQDVRSMLIERAGAAAAAMRAAGLAVGEPVVLEGDPKRVLLAEAESWQADSVFVGAKGLSRVQRVLLGSVSSTLAARAPCSVEVSRTRALSAAE